MACLTRSTRPEARPCTVPSSEMSGMCCTTAAVAPAAWILEPGSPLFIALTRSFITPEVSGVYRGDCKGSQTFEIPFQYRYQAIPDLEHA